MYHAGAQTPPWPQTHHQSLQSIPLTRNGEGPCVVGTLDAVSSLCASYVNIQEPSEIPTGWTILSPSKSPSMLTSHPQTWWDGNLGPGGQNGDAPQGPARPWSWTKAPQTMPGAPGKKEHYSRVPHLQCELAHPATTAMDIPRHGSILRAKVQGSGRGWWDVAGIAIWGKGGRGRESGPGGLGCPAGDPT